MEVEGGLMGAEFSIRVLGPVDVVVGGDERHIGSRNLRAALAALVLAAGRAVPIDVLRDSIWPERPPAAADESIHTYVSRLRHLLGTGAIERLDHSYALRATREQIDATRFEDLVDEAAQTRGQPEQCALVCTRALSLWRGTPFGDLGDVEAFRLESMRLEELRLVAMELALDAEVALGHHEIAAAELESFVREHPYRERLWLLLAEALRLDGRRIEALRACQGLRGVLAEAGLDPTPELTALERRIVAADDT